MFNEARFEKFQTSRLKRYIAFPLFLNVNYLCKYLRKHKFKYLTKHLADFIIFVCQTAISFLLLDETFRCFHNFRVIFIKILYLQNVHVKYLLKNTKQQHKYNETLVLFTY